MITVVPLGTKAESTTGLTTTLASLTVPMGAHIVVGLARMQSNGSESMMFGSIPLTVSGTFISATADASIWYAKVPVTTTADLVMTYAADPAETPRAMIASYVTGLQDSPYAEALGAGFSGTGTEPASTAQWALPTATDALFYGIIVTIGPTADEPGAWSNDFTSGQRVGTTAGAAGDLTIAEGYRVVMDVAAAPEAAKTEITSRVWIAQVSRLMAVASGGPVLSGRFAPEIIEPSHSVAPNFKPPDYWSKHVSKWTKRRR